jgi:hypothetical protein
MADVGVQINIDLVKAAEDVVSAVGAGLADSNRSVIVEVDNQLPIRLVFDSTDHDHGGFGDILPKGTIEPMSADVYGSRSSGFLTGTEGHVFYRFNGHKFFIHWDNPEVGGNSSDSHVEPDDPRFAVLSITGNGNNSHTRFIIAEVTQLPQTRPVQPHSGNFIQSRFGRQENFELLVPVGGRLVHFFRANDEPGLPWHKAAELPNSAGTASATLIESNFGSPGNLEVVARLGDGLVFYFFDGAVLQWKGPLPVQVDGQPITGVTGF